MILYPTETVYGIGVNALDKEEIEKLYKVKGRDEWKKVSWLVRDLEDIKKYAKVGEVATKIANKFLPGPLTLVLPLKDEVLKEYPFCSETVGFRISTDPVSRKVISDFMEENNAPLTSTSANISGKETKDTVPEILNQFGDMAKMFDSVVDDGERHGTPSTVVEVRNDEIIVHREGQIPAEEIMSLI